MASFHVSMPDDMRDFIHQRARDGGFGTPTEYVRSLIREDRRLAEQECYGPLILKWLAEGELSAEEREALPPGLLDRVTRNLRRMLTAGIESGPGREVSSQELRRRMDEAVARTERKPTERP